MFDPKPISPEAIPPALEKAHRYRLLNEPAEAESICRDVLRIDPENQDALVILVLALTDQFGAGGAATHANARQLLPRLRGEFERAYYAGITCERWGKAQLEAGAPGHVVYDWLRLAMDWFEKAQAVSHPGNDDAILRWNACARCIQNNDQVRPLEAQIGVADDFGDI